MEAEGHTEAVAPLEPLMDLRGITKCSPFERGRQNVYAVCTEEEAEALSREDFLGSGRKSRAGSGNRQKGGGGMLVLGTLGWRVTLVHNALTVRVLLRGAHPRCPAGLCHHHRQP